MMGSTIADNELSAFERIPIEIRKQIYEELMKGENVRLPPNETLVQHYHFETAILSVNRKIYNEA